MMELQSVKKKYSSTQSRARVKDYKGGNNNKQSEEGQQNGNQEINFKDRDARISSGLDNASTYPIQLVDTVLENVTVKEIFQYIFSDDEAISEETGKSYQNFFIYAICETIKGTETKCFNCRDITKWDPQPPQYFQKKSKLSKKEQLKELYNFSDQSKRNHFYSINLKELQLIPFAPKSCEGKEYWSISWLSPDHIILDYDFYSANVPYCDSHFIRNRMEFIQEGSGVRYIFRMKAVWLKSILIKSLVESQSKEETRKSIEDNFVPRLKKMIPIFQQKNQNQNQTNGSQNQSYMGSLNSSFQSHFIENGQSNQQQQKLRDFSLRVRTIGGDVDQNLNNIKNDKDTNSIFEFESPIIRVENCSVKQFYQMVYSDDAYTSSLTQKSYRNFQNMLLMEDANGNPYTISEVKQYTQWEPKPPKYFTNPKSLKSEVYELQKSTQKYSERNSEYVVDLKDMKLVPMMPNSCLGFEKHKIYWVSYNHLIVEYRFHIKGLSMMENFYCVTMADIKQDQKAVVMTQKTKNVWTKSSMFKGIFNKQILKDNTDTVNNIVNPTIQREYPIFNQKYQQKRAQSSSGSLNQEQKIDFNQRKATIISQILPQEKFDKKLGEKIYENCTLQQFVNLFLSDEQYIDSATQKQYVSFMHYLKGIFPVHSNFGLEKCKLVPEMPEYYKNINSKDLKSLFNSPNQSKSSISYKKDLPDMKGVPFAPKFVNVTENFTVNWISDKIVILNQFNEISGAPASDTHTVHLRYIFEDKGNNSVSFGFYYYLEWHKSTFMKKMIIEKALEGTQKNLDEMIFPTLQRELPIYLEKNKQQNGQVVKKKPIDIYKDRRQQSYAQFPDDSNYNVICSEVVDNCTVFDFFKFRFDKDCPLKSNKTNKEYPSYNDYFYAELLPEEFNQTYTYPDEKEYPEYFQNRKNPKKLLKYPLFQTMIFAFQKNMPIKIPMMDSVQKIEETNKFYFISPDEIVIIGNRRMLSMDSFSTHSRVNIKKDVNGVRFEFKYINEFYKSTFLKSMIQSKAKEEIGKNMRDRLLVAAKEYMPTIVERNKKLYPIQEDEEEQEENNDQQQQQDTVQPKQIDITPPIQQQIQQQQVKVKEEQKKKSSVIKKMAKGSLIFIIIYFILFQLIQNFGHLL